MNHLPLLLKREYWEHRGGFLWTPFWTMAVILLLTVLGIASAELRGVGDAHIQFGVPLGELRQHLDAAGIAKAANAFDMVQATFVGIAGIGLFFVTFFYLLGALYDDRRDRSILFWKSLPLSDSASVLSKALSAMFVMPLIALVVATLAYLVLLVLLCAWAALHGVNPLPLFWASHPLGMFARFVAMLPIGALWMLPAVGWLLFWSAFVHSKPFVWAVLVPVIVVVADKWLGVLGAPHLGGNFPLGYALSRLLVSVFPGSWLAAGDFSFGKERISFDIANDAHVLGSFDPRNMYAMLGSADLWIGAAAGAALIAAAIWFRKRRIEVNA